ncbi:MAG: hypothetical protein ACHBN1_29390 [Heteroscytonema crispum UTEX LB 1556]
MGSAIARVLPLKDIAKKRSQTQNPKPKKSLFVARVFAIALLLFILQLASFLQYGLETVR